MPVLVYDGDCGFCRRWCRFIQRKARTPLMLMTFEEARAAGLLASLSDADLRAAANYIDGSREYHGGAAATRALRLLPLGGVFALLDLPGVSLLRDLGYAFVAANRGRLGFCAPRDVAYTVAVPTPLQNLEACLDRIDAVEPDLQAWVEIDRDGARDAAKRGDGPLAGVVAGIKDIIDVAGLPTRCGAAEFAHRLPEKDATCVARLRSAGAIILGKTHTTSFAFLDPAPTRNPWNREHTPGGSSSGSAAAVGAGMLPLALGSQTVGSVLRPAAYCGVVGLKPSFGRISYAGVAPLAASFDHIGVFTRSVADAALALSVLAGHDPGDAFSADEPVVDDYVGALGRTPAPRLGIVRAYYKDDCGEDVMRHVEAVAERLSASGASVSDAEMPGNATAIRDAGDPVLRYEAAAAHAQLFAAHADAYRPAIRRLVEAGLKTGDAEYRAARQAVRDIREAMIENLHGYDAFLLPVAPETAPGLETTGSGIFCAPASFAGLPAISLPSGLDANGMPFAIQLIAGPFAEARLLATAAWVERVLDFHERPNL